MSRRVYTESRYRINSEACVVFATAAVLSPSICSANSPGVGEAVLTSRYRESKNFKSRSKGEMERQAYPLMYKDDDTSL